MSSYGREQDITVLRVEGPYSPLSQLERILSGDNRRVEEFIYHSHAIQPVDPSRGISRGPEMASMFGISHKPREFAFRHGKIIRSRNDDRLDQIESLGWR